MHSIFRRRPRLSDWSWACVPSRVLGLVAVPLGYVVFKRLLAIVESVRAGDPFVVANASRLQVIARMLLALQVLSIVIGTIGRVLSTPAHPVHLDAGFSISGWLAVLLTFVLARVFAEGALHARRPGKDGVTWRSPSSSTTCFTTGG